MKKIYLSIVTIIFAISSSYAQWTNVSGTGNYYLNSGNVAIGATSSSYHLNLQGAESTNPSFLIQNTSYNSTMSTGTVSMQFGFADHVGPKIEAYKTSVNITGLKFYTEYGYNSPQLGLTIYPTSTGGNVGIGTANPNAALVVNSGELTVGANGVLSQGGEIFRAHNQTNGNLLIANPTASFSGGTNLVSINDAADAILPLQIRANPLVVTEGNLGVGNENPVSLFQVDDGVSKASIGDAGGSSALNWGTSYLGFNASRSGTNWLTNGDGGNNGGGVVYSSIFGDMYFSIIPRTGGSGQSLTDANVASNIAMRIDHTDGAVYAKQVYVQTSGWPDFVFKKNYALRPLSEVKSYIEQNQHLPDMPAAAAVEKNGISLGEMNKALLKKVEELTLYLIEKDKEINAQKEINKQQQETNQSLEQKFNKLASQLDMLTKKSN